MITCDVVDFNSLQGCCLATTFRIKLLFPSTERQ